MITRPNTAATYAELRENCYLPLEGHRWAGISGNKYPHLHCQLLNEVWEWEDPGYSPSDHSGNCVRNVVLQVMWSQKSCMCKHWTGQKDVHQWHLPEIFSISILKNWMNTKVTKLVYTAKRSRSKDWLPYLEEELVITNDQKMNLQKYKTLEKIHLNI